MQINLEMKWILLLILSTTRAAKLNMERICSTKWPWKFDRTKSVQNIILVRTVRAWKDNRKHTTLTELRRKASYIDSTVPRWRSPAVSYTLHIYTSQSPWRFARWYPHTHRGTSLNTGHSQYRICKVNNTHSYKELALFSTTIHFMYVSRFQKSTGPKYAQLYCQEMSSVFFIAICLRACKNNGILEKLFKLSNFWQTFHIF